MTILDLIEKKKNKIPLTKEEIIKELDPRKYIGRSVSQTEEFIRDVIDPILKKYNTESINSVLNV